MNELTVVLPAYNEEKNISTLVSSWFAFADKILEKYGLILKVVAVNDGSCDDTKKVALRLENKYENFTLINHESNKGLGQAVKTGILYILNNCPNSLYTCIMDCDNTHNPKYIFDMLDKLQSTGADVVIASRYQKGAKVQGVSQIRLLTSSGARFIFTLLLRVKNVRDYTCGYRLYSNSMLKRAYQQYKENIVEENGFTSMAELLYKLYTCGARFSEIPFELRYDKKGGNSKMKVFKTAFDSIALIFKLKKHKKMSVKSLLIK